MVVVWVVVVSECVLFGIECVMLVWRLELENEWKGFGNVGGFKIDLGGEIEVGDEVSEIGSVLVMICFCL